MTTTNRFVVSYVDRDCETRDLASVSTLMEALEIETRERLSRPRLPVFVWDREEPEAGHLSELDLEQYGEWPGEPVKET